MRPIDADHLIEQLEILERSPWCSGKDSDNILERMQYRMRADSINIIKRVFIENEPTIEPEKDSSCP